MENKTQISRPFATKDEYCPYCKCYQGGKVRTYDRISTKERMTAMQICHCPCHWPAYHAQFMLKVVKELKIIETLNEMGKNAANTAKTPSAPTEPGKGPLLPPITDK